MSSCPDCHVDQPHARVDCPLCDWPSFAHLNGLYSHLARSHKVLTGSRLHALAMDVARAQVRGWPIDGPTFAMREAFQLAGVTA
jgi:hypothetical protein